MDAADAQPPDAFEVIRMWFRGVPLESLMPRRSDLFGPDGRPSEDLIAATYGCLRGVFTRRPPGCEACGFGRRLERPRYCVCGMDSMPPGTDEESRNRYKQTTIRE